MYFIKDDFIGMTYSPKPGDEGYSRYDEESDLVVPFCRYP